MGQRRVSRRSVLTGIGMAALGIAGASMANDALTGGAPPQRPLLINGASFGVPTVPPGEVRVQRVASRARGRDVNLALMAPNGVAMAGLPVCLALHPHGGSALEMVGLGLPRFLTAAVRSGIPPFALVAVDSGDTYYHRRSANDDPQAMLRDELPGWLVADGLAPDNAGLPAATMGISMGAFGELNYAAGRAGHNPLRAIAAVSPAVFRSWQDVTIKRAFNGPADWAAHEPLQHLALAGQPLGVWCGTGDRFIGAARELARLGRATVSSFTAGGHSTSYWHHVLPDVLRFVGARLSVA